MENMTWSIYSEDFIKEVANKTGFDIDVVRELSNEFKEIIQPEVEEHYLSHLISSIESIIHRDFTTKFIKNIKEQSILESRTDLINTIKNNKIRFYPILLKKTPNLPTEAYVDYIKNNA